jgi:hypothetical protein
LKDCFHGRDQFDLDVNRMAKGLAKTRLHALGIGLGWGGDGNTDDPDLTDIRGSGPQLPRPEGEPPYRFPIRPPGSRSASPNSASLTPSSRPSFLLQEGKIQVSAIRSASASDIDQRLGICSVLNPTLESAMNPPGAG